MIDEGRTDRKDKRKADSSELIDPHRRAPVRPVVGPSVDQLNNSFQNLMSNSNTPPIVAHTSSGGTRLNSHDDQSISKLQNQASSFITGSPGAVPHPKSANLITNSSSQRGFAETTSLPDQSVTNVLTVSSSRSQSSAVDSHRLLSRPDASTSSSSSVTIPSFAGEDPFAGQPDHKMSSSFSSSVTNAPASFSTASFSTVPTASFETAALTDQFDLIELADRLEADPTLYDKLLKQNPYYLAERTLFNILLSHADVMFQVCRWLPAEDLVNFYAVSKYFHRTINTQLTTLIIGNARTRMPESAEVFHFKAYKPLCMLDAALNKSVDKAMVRDVPTFRWLRFLEFREHTVQSLLEQLALKGLRLPRAASRVLKKIWFLMDIPDTRRRIGCIHNPSLWSDSELFVACMFILKLDMAFADPMLNQSERRMRKMMLAQRTLSVLDRVLKRQMMRNQYEMLQMYTEWRMNLARYLDRIPNEPLKIPRTLFGVPTRSVGSLRWENWTLGRTPLIRPDELIMKESIRRRLGFRDKLLDMMLWGNTHPVTHQDVFPRDWKGDVQIAFEDEVEDQVEKDIAIHASRSGTEFDWDID